jgi:D-sedoheptulose 7-phosphate isomerase
VTDPAAPLDGPASAALRQRGEEVTAGVDAFLEASGAALDAAAEAIVEALERDRRVLLCGNGGSAAQAMHLEAELVGRYKADRPGLPALYLGLSAPTSTAIVNDFSPDDVFARPLAALGRPGDVLVALSTSGSSPNVVRALEAARAAGIASVLLTGPRGAGADADVVLAFPGAGADRIQDLHQLAVHALMDAVEARVAGAQKGR